MTDGDESNWTPSPAWLETVKELKEEAHRVRVPVPSRDYHAATRSPIYRLSELMFGSLLAAYVLGFIGFVSNTERPPVGQAGTASRLLSLDWFLALPEQLCWLTYLAISLAFAYVTASLYVSYHSGLLTMPHAPLKRLRWDFLLALSHAVLFGLSMYSPRSFPLWLSAVFLGAIVRQAWEHKRLMFDLNDRVRGTLDSKKQEADRRDATVRVGRKPEKDAKQVRDEEREERAQEEAEALRQCIRSFREIMENEVSPGATANKGRALAKKSRLRLDKLKDWRQVRLEGVLLALAPIPIWVLLLWLHDRQHATSPQTLAAAVVILVGVGILANRNLREKATTMTEVSARDEMDLQAATLFMELRARLAATETRA